MRGVAMTEGTPWKHILRFALPVLLGSFLQQLYNTVDAIIVGNFASQQALSAVGTTSSFTFMFLALALGFSAGNGVVVAQYYGAKDEKQVRANASTGILMLIGMGILVTIFGLIIAKPAFTYFIDVPKEIIDMTFQYFIIFTLGLTFQYGYNIFSSILRAVGDSKATLYFLLIASAMNVALDLLFVAVFHWSVVGAAVATVISQAASCFAAYFYMRRKYPIFRFGIKDYKWNGNLVKKTLKVGFPMAMQQLIVSGGLTFIQRAVNGFGETMIASFTVGQRIEMYMNIPCMAFQTTLATYTGQNIGAGKIDRVKKGAIQTIIMSLAITGVVSLVVTFMAGTLAGAFALEPAATAYCIEHLRTIALINIVLASYFPLFGLFQGSNHPLVATVTVTAALAIRVSVTYILGMEQYLGHIMVWWNGIFGFSVACIIAWSYYLSKKWTKKSDLRM